MRKMFCILASVAMVFAALANGPLMGWSSWNTYRININDSLIYSQAQALVALGLDTVGYRYVNIDDGFFGGRDIVSGDLKFHPERFPNGLTNLVRQIHGLGLKAGIYSDAGRNTCGNFWDNDTVAHDVGLYGYERKDCKLFFDSIGFDRIKVDFCGGDSAQNSYHMSLSPQERYTSIRATIDSVASRDVRLSVCRWQFPGEWVRSVGDDWRISADIDCSWESVRGIIEINKSLFPYASYGHYNDMDMLEIGRGLTHEEERSHFGMWCMMSSPLIIGCDLLSIPHQSLELLKNQELIAINQDSLGQQARPLKNIGQGIVFVRDLAGTGKEMAVAFYNPGDEPVEMAVSCGELGFATPVAVRDLFLHKNLGKTGTIKQCVEPHNTYIYRIGREF